ncbi:MAG: DUF2180 family protein [Chloroflexi bacterium]|nr:DUF2180 family protein [Chloroflexota bacterium]
MGAREDTVFCHECAMDGRQEPAVALCRFCNIGLCKVHLVELYERPHAVPQYACHHTPWAPPLVAPSRRAKSGLVPSSDGRREPVGVGS